MLEAKPSKYTNYYNGIQTVVDISAVLELADDTIKETIEFLEDYKNHNIKSKQKDNHYYDIGMRDYFLCKLIERLKGISNRISTDVDTFFDERMFTSEPQNADRERILSAGGGYAVMKYKAKEFLELVNAGKQYIILENGDFDDIALLSVYMFAKQEKEKQATAKHDCKSDSKGGRDYASA